MFGWINRRLKMISIKKITFRNFKLFGPEDYSIGFEGSDLVLMDGPNGYGKTSVFDALELAFTGNIGRLIPLENRQIPNDVVVAHNSAADVEIQLELGGKKNVSILRKLKSPLPKDATKISKFQELWDTFEKCDDKWIQINPNEIDRILNNRKFLRDYHLFHYIQQEESARFLKTNNENQRAEALAGLFGGTEVVEEKLNKLLSLQKKVDSLRMETRRQIGEINAENDIQSLGLQEAETIHHEYILPWINESDRPEWDNLTVKDWSKDKLNYFLDELASISTFVEFRSEFLKDRVYVRSSQQVDLLKSYIKFFNVLNDVDHYIELNALGRLLRQSLIVLSQGDLLSIARLDIGALFESINIGSSKEFMDKLNDLISAEKEQTGASAEYSDLIKHRELLINHLDKAAEICDCPLCGNNYDSHEVLMSYVIKQGQFLRGLLDGQQRRLVLMRDMFRTEHLTPLVELVSENISKVSYLGDDELTGLVAAKQLEERLHRLSAWLNSENIISDDLVEKKLPSKRDSDEIENAVRRLSARIRENSPAQSDEFSDANANGQFERIHRIFFMQDASLVNSFSGNSISDKVNYLRIQYSKSLDSVLKRRKVGEARMIKLDHKKAQLAEIIGVVRTQISQYRKRLITDIEIPFFIYSGKILQTHQVGVGHGIFIKDPTGGDQLKNVRFVANLEGDHDVLNTMSSGQISAVVISLTLALNKVYSKNFKTILIDDPVQTMDDINMSSLVELLRNDFSDRQIILSTHEDKVSRYFIYKFLKYNKSVRVVNLMRREEYVPAKRYVYERSSSPSFIPNSPR
ncbi:AAA family ATPase [Janthinobacterium sp. PSPC2-1]|uniref:AAA family ATPase n=1 Tax=unclassified Janthinobacterium TaxID=2610881 RepID=UPI003CEB82FF